MDLSSKEIIDKVQSIIDVLKAKNTPIMDEWSEGYRDALVDIETFLLKLK
jgi:hypothetical protein